MSGQKWKQAIRQMENKVSSHVVLLHIQNTNIRPFIILEWIHIQKNKAEDLIELLELNNSMKLVDNI